MSRLKIFFKLLWEDVKLPSGGLMIMAGIAICVCLTMVALMATFGAGWLLCSWIGEPFTRVDAVQVGSGVLIFVMIVILLIGWIIALWHRSGEKIKEYKIK